MRVALLTTDTPHHTYYAWRLSQERPLAAIVLERRALQAPFETFHSFERLRDEYERDELLAGFGGTLADLAPLSVVDSADDAAADLAAAGLDAVLVFGTGLLGPETIAAAPTCLNLHGGDPEEYRGLDTHLWAIYHGDFPALVTTLHHVDAELDCGDIAFRAPVPLRPGMPLHELRARNTEVCVELSLRALRELEASGTVARTPQAKRGRYYSFMPAVLKDLCVRRFERHTASL